jgi:hypothetical protein
VKVQSQVCIHEWYISSPIEGEHQIGRCRLCGETRDFTAIQYTDSGYRSQFVTNVRPAWIKPGTVGMAVSGILFRGEQNLRKSRAV